MRFIIMAMEPRPRSPETKHRRACGSTNEISARAASQWSLQRNDISTLCLYLVQKDFSRESHKPSSGRDSITRRV